MPSLSTLLKIVVTLSVLGCLTSGAAAAVRVAGNAEQLVLKVENASLDEVLATVRQVLSIKVSVKGGTARTFTGTYSGSLEGALMRLLFSSYQNFYLVVRSGALQVTLLDCRLCDAVPVTSTDFADANDPGLMALAAAAAQGGGSRDSRIRQERLSRSGGTVDPH